jgi:hypothetical protein
LLVAGINPFSFFVPIDAGLSLYIDTPKKQCTIGVRSSLKAYENPDARASTLELAEKDWNQLELWKY